MVSVGGWRGAATALSLLVGLGVTGCGTDGGSGDTPVDASGDTSAPSEPATKPGRSDKATDEPVPDGAQQCAQVWREGATLPRAYPGCVAEGDFVRSDRLSCSSGQRLVRFDNRFYAVPGGTVREARPTLAKDRDYRDALASCRA